jgi:SAM-dependent methyltransferase
MEHEGMVHALQETRRLLKPGGVLVNILPVPEGYFIEVHHDGRILFSERKRETCSEDVLRAEVAIRQVLDRGLFVIDQKDEFEFLTYGSSVPEVRAYWEEQNAYEDEPKAKDIFAREEYLYAQVEEILDEPGEGAEVVIRERVRIERLSPVK